MHDAMTLSDLEPAKSAAILNPGSQIGRRKDMARGTIELVCGPMFAGKSTEVLRQFGRICAAGKREKLAIFTPKADVRGGEHCMTTHDGDVLLATPIDAPVPIAERIEFVIIDEVQFLDGDRFSGDVVTWIAEIKASGRSVLAAGLDHDWQGHEFPVVSALAKLADRVLRLRSRCTVCGRPATRTWRLSGSGDVFLPGGAEAYEVLCVEHWREAAERSGLPVMADEA